MSTLRLKEKYAITGRVKSCHCYYYYYYMTITMQLYNFASLKVVSFAAAWAGVMQACCPQSGVRRWTWGQYTVRKQGLDLVLGNCPHAQMWEWVLEKIKDVFTLVPREFFTLL